MSQTSYAVNTDAAFAGQLGDVGPHDIESKTNLTVTVPFGQAQVQGTKDYECKFPSSLSDKLLGVSVAQQTNENLVGSGGSYPALKPLSLMKKGRVWVAPEVAVTPADPVYMRVTTHGMLVPGSFTKTADTVSMVDTCVLVPGAVWKNSSASNGGFALLEINLPQ